MTIEEMFAVLEAIRDGKPIQRSELGGGGLLMDVMVDANYRPNFRMYTYRVKPRAWYANIYPSNTRGVSAGLMYGSRAEADESGGRRSHRLHPY
jgi:hypothetical protein